MNCGICQRHKVLVEFVPGIGKLLETLALCRLGLGAIMMPAKLIRLYMQPTTKLAAAEICLLIVGELTHDEDILYQYKIKY